MKLRSWGCFPVIDARVAHPADTAAIRAAVGDSRSLTIYGLGRSYGDSPLGPDVLMTDRLGFILEWDPARGIVRVQAGVSLDELLKVIVPRGWFLSVTPGTRFVTVGGAIASDVHGKNHHVSGCFSTAVVEFRLMQASGEVVHCSPGVNSALFRATCGGMGLTGVILDATLQLTRIGSSLIDQVTYKCSGLDDLLERFEETAATTFSVAWVDCLARGRILGRGLLTIGEFSHEGPLETHHDPRFGIPITPPVAFVGRATISAFNSLYFHQVMSRVSKRRVHYETFFYPLDKARDWNRLYGPGGFTQYQFAIPRAAGPEGLRHILTKISESGMASGLAVLKVFGAANDNLLSFPIQGYTLAVDLKHQHGLFGLLEQLDKRVLDLGGRIYLTKDVRMSEETFKRSYPRWPEFQKIRESVGAIGRFASRQSRRLGLN